MCLLFPVMTIHVTVHNLIFVFIVYLWEVFHRFFFSFLLFFDKHSPVFFEEGLVSQLLKIVDKVFYEYLCSSSIILKNELLWSEYFTFVILNCVGGNMVILFWQVRVAQTACMSACQHVAKSLMSMLLSEDVKQMSLAALEQVNLDVIQCERMLEALLFQYFFYPRFNGEFM